MALAPIYRPRQIAALALAVFASAAPTHPIQAQNATMPALAYSTYLGGGTPGDNGETGAAITTGPDGFVYLTGYSSSATNFPFTARIASGYLGTNATQGSFVAKFNPTTKAFSYITLVPWCSARAIVVDAAGCAYIAGTAGDLLPTTNAFQVNGLGGNLEAFVAKLSADGTSLAYCTYLSGSGADAARAIAVNSNGEAIVFGSTDSTNFPVTPDALQTNLGGGFDMFLTKFDATGSHLLSSTFLGGEGDDFGMGMTLDVSGNVFIAGQTSSTNLPAAAAFTQIGTNGPTKAFIAKLSPGFGTLQYVTLLGDGLSSDPGDDLAASIAACVAVDSAGGACIFGQTSATNFPVTTNAPQPNYGGGNWDAFVAKLDPTGTTLRYATYLGGSGSEDMREPVYASQGYIYPTLAGLALDPSGNAYVCGQSSSYDAPVGTDPANTLSGNFAAYVSKLDPTGSTNLYLRYLANSYQVGCGGVACVGNGNVFVIGSTGLAIDSPYSFAAYYPTTPDAFQPIYGDGWSDALLAEFSETGSINGNDNYANRVALSEARMTVQANNSAATAEPGEPPHGNAPAAHSLWWSWTAPANGKLEVSGAYSGISPLISVYNNNTLATLQTVASNYDANAQVTAEDVRFPVSAGTTYQISVDGENSSVGSISLTLTFSQPPNDDFADSIVLTGFPVSATGSNTNTTLEPGEPSDYGADRSVWWSWTAPVSGNVVISTLGSSFFTDLEVFTNDTLATLGGVGAPVANPTNSVLPILAQAGVTYHIAVLGYNAASGTINLNIGTGTPPASDSFSNAAVLSGYIASGTNNNVDASAEPGEPLLGANVGIVDYAPAAGRTVWWVWTAPTNGWLRVNVTSDFYNRMAVFTGFALDDLTAVASFDANLHNTFTSHVDFPVTVNTAYHIDVDGAANSPGGNIVISLFFYQPPTIVADSLGGPPHGPIHFSVTNAVAGTNYVVQSSTDLIHWSGIPSAVFSGPFFNFTDSGSGVSNRLFYRVMQQ